MFLVHKHLAMAHLAFRRDLSDPDMLLRFGREVGSPECLRMLYVHTAADMTAVGPGTWTEWKQELLTGLYDNAMLVLSGEHQHFGESERLERMRDGVWKCLVENRLQALCQDDEPATLPDERSLAPAAAGASPADLTGQDLRCLRVLDKQLQAFPTHYLTATAPEQIAADLHSIHCLRSQAVVVHGKYESATDTSEYRVITQHGGLGCFSKIRGRSRPSGWRFCQPRSAPPPPA